MKLRPTELPDVVLIEPRVFEDARGFFMETFHKERFAQAGLPTDFTQDNHSRSRRGTLRGLHYQIEHAQGKLIRVARGEVFDVAVDLRRDSATFGRWVGAVLSETNRLQLYMPPGFAHGFCVTSDEADVVYKCTDLYYAQHERVLLWNDPELAIDWPIKNPLVSDKDLHGLTLAEAPYFRGQF